MGELAYVTGPVYFDEDIYFDSDVASSAQVPWPYNCAIDGRGFLLDLAHYSERTVDQLRDARDNADEPGEGSLSTTGAWKRTRVDWTHGAGQRWADEEEHDRQRFLSSWELDVTQERGLQLGKGQTIIDVASSATNQQLLPAGAYLYYVKNTTLRHTQDITIGLPTLTTVTGGSGTHQAVLTTDGNEVYFADATGVRKTTIGTGTSTAFGGAAATYLPTLLQWTQGWLLGANNASPDINTISAAGALTVLWTHPVSAFRWVAAVGTPHAIYAAGQGNDRGEIYRWTVKDDGTLPTAALLAASFPAAEYVRSLAYTGELLIIGTSKGVHLASVNDDATLAIGPLIDTGECAKVWADGRYAYFNWTNMTRPNGVVSACVLGAMDLATFTAPLVPAYFMVGQSGSVMQTLAAFEGYPVLANEFAAYNLRSNNYALQGDIDLGRFGFGVREPKTFLGAEVVHDPLANSDITISVYDDRGDLVVNGERKLVNAEGSTGVGIDLVGASPKISEWFRVVVAIETSSSDVIDVIRRITLRGLPVLRQLTEIILPLQIFETLNLEVAEGQDVGMDTYETYLWLKDCEQSQRVCTLQLGARSWSAQVRGVAVPEGAANSWNDQRTWLQGTVFVTMLAREV